MMLLMIRGSHLCKREVGSLRMNLWGGANSRALAEPGKCSMTINGHANEGLAKPGRVLCEVYCRLHKWRNVQRHRVYMPLVS